MCQVVGRGSKRQAKTDCFIFIFCQKPKLVLHTAVMSPVLHFMTEAIKYPGDAGLLGLDFLKIQISTKIETRLKNINNKIKKQLDRSYFLF
jgi:hypothetical protein